MPICAACRDRADAGDGCSSAESCSTGCVCQHKAPLPDPEPVTGAPGE